MKGSGSCMFRRPFLDLLGGLQCRFPGCDVEIYHRTRLETFTSSAATGSGCTAVTEVRIVSSSGERSVCLSDQLPVTDTVLVLLDLADEETDNIPPVESKLACSRTEVHEATESHNWRGLARDILVNSQGAEALAEVAFSLHRSRGRIARGPLPLSGSLHAGGEAVLLTPWATADAIMDGAFRPFVAAGTGPGIFHACFDGIGLDKWEWVRAPGSLKRVHGSLTITGMERNHVESGTTMDALTASSDGWTGWFNGRPICTFQGDVLESCTAVSDMYSFFDGRLYWSLPFVRLQGAIHWH